MVNNGNEADLEGYSDAERLRDIRAVWLAGLPLKAAFYLIGRAAFDQTQKSGE